MCYVHIVYLGTHLCVVYTCVYTCVCICTSVPLHVCVLMYVYVSCVYVITALVCVHAFMRTHIKVLYNCVNMRVKKCIAVYAREKSSSATGNVLRGCVRFCVIHGIRVFVIRNTLYCKILISITGVIRIVSHQFAILR